MTSGPNEDLEGKSAIDFAEKYLRKISVNPNTWEIEYENPETGEKWLMDYPESGAQGGGSPRLHKQD